MVAILHFSWLGSIATLFLAITHGYRQKMHQLSTENAFTQKSSSTKNAEYALDHAAGETPKRRERLSLLLALLSLGDFTASFALQPGRGFLPVTHLQHHSQEKNSIAMQYFNAEEARIMNYHTALQMPRKQFLTRATAAFLAGAAGNVLDHPEAAARTLVLPKEVIGSASVMYHPQTETFKAAQAVFTLIPTLKAQPDTRVICVGEEHPHPLHHAFQLDVIKAIDQMDSVPTLIGMEMCWRKHQADLDNFVFGDKSSGGGSLDELADRTQWLANWGYPIKLYADILNYAREKRIRLVGLNIPGPVAREVGKRGIQEVFGRLPNKTLASMPQVDLSDEEHKRRFKEKLGARVDAMEPQRLQYMYEAMALWDDYMADTVAKFMSDMQQSGARMVVLAGVGHVQGRVGIPDRVAKRVPVQTLTVVPNSVPWPTKNQRLPVESASSKEGDWLLYTRPFEDLLSTGLDGRKVVPDWALVSSIDRWAFD